MRACASSCATCHDPHFAYGPPNARSTQLGGPDLESVALRAAPALRYLKAVPPFSEDHVDEAVDESIDQGPMANPDVDSVVARVAESPLAARFKSVFGDDVFADPVRGATALLMCLEVPRRFVTATSTERQASPRPPHRFVRRPSGESNRPLWRNLRLTPAFCRFAALRVDFRDGRPAAAPASS
jgi:hypothetical protein